MPSSLRAVSDTSRGPRRRRPRWLAATAWHRLGDPARGLTPGRRPCAGHCGRRARRQSRAAPAPRASLPRQARRVGPVGADRHGQDHLQEGVAHATQSHAATTPAGTPCVWAHHPDPQPSGGAALTARGPAARAPWAQGLAHEFCAPRLPPPPRPPVWPKYSCGLAVVVFQEPTEPLSALDRPFTIIGRLPGTKRNYIAESLMTTFLVVMLDVLAQHMTQ